MKSLLLVLTLLLSNIATAQEIYIFEDSKYFDYTITLSDIVPGHSARAVQNGFLLGVAKNKRKPLDVKKPIAEIFQETIEDNKKETDLINQSAQAVNKELSEVDGQFGSVEKPDPSMKAGDNKVRWSEVQECAVKNLPLLKKAVYLKEKMETNSDFKTHYDLVKSIYLEDASIDGFVCGQHLNPNLSMNIADEILNIKVLSALLSRRNNKEKQYLYETLLAAYSDSAPEEARMLFVYFWAKLSFMAVTGTKELPSHSAMAQEFEEKPDVVEEEMLVNGEKVPVKTEIKYLNIPDLMSIGNSFVASLGVQYEP